MGTTKRQTSSHADVTRRCGAKRSHKEAPPADKAERGIPYEPNAGDAVCRFIRWPHDVAQHDEPQKEHRHLGDRRILHFQETLGSFLQIEKGDNHEGGREGGREGGVRRKKRDLSNSQAGGDRGRQPGACGCLQA